MRAIYLAVGIYRVVDRFWKQLGFPSGHGIADLDGSDDDSTEPDVSIGPILTPQDAPRLFELLHRLAHKLGCRLPGEVRLSYLPACGVLEVPVNEVYTRQVLVIGLPCLQIWSRHELKAVLAHELAHLRNEDAAFTRDVLQLIDRLRHGGESEGIGSRWSPRSLWTNAFVACIGPVAARVSRWMEYRADLCSARTYGSGPLATALEKMAVVQPVFQEVLTVADQLDSANVYRVFGRAWTGLNGGAYERLRDRLVEASRDDRTGVHPPVADRLKRLQKLRAGKRREFFPSLHLLNDPSVLERLFHNRLYGLHKHRSVFQPATATPPTVRGVSRMAEIG